MQERLNNFLDDLDDILDDIADIRNLLSFHKEEAPRESIEYKYQSILNIQLTLIKKLNKDVRELYRKIDDTELEVLQGRLKI